MRDIYINGAIYTVTQGFAEAFVVENQKFLFVGSTEEAMTYQQPDSQMIDLEGKFITAGFNDSHNHLLFMGDSLSMVNLTNASSVDELVERSKKFVTDNQVGPNEIILGFGFNQDYYEGLQYPTRFDLDRVSTQQPVVFIRTCTHMYVANSKAMELFGITKDTPQVEGGIFDVDDQGEPLGIFRENAVTLLKDHIPQLTVEDLKSRIVKSIALSNSYGVTSTGSDDLTVFSNLPFELIGQAFEELDGEGKLNLKINEQCKFLTFEDYQRFLDNQVYQYQGNCFHYGPLKLFVDGSLGARTASLQTPYEDDPGNYGQDVLTQEELYDWVGTAHRNGLQVVAHSIGDKSALHILNAVEAAQKVDGRTDLRHGIVHAQILTYDLVDRMAELGVQVLTQTIFIDYDAIMAEERVGKERLDMSYTYKNMLEKGINVSNGSDSPIELPNVLRGMEIAMTRESITTPGRFINPDQAFTLEEAIYSYTMAGAYGTFEEHEKGSIEVGKWADFVMLDQNLFEINVHHIHNVQVLSTYVNGTQVFTRNP